MMAVESAIGLYAAESQQFCQDNSAYPDLANPAWQDFVARGLPTKQLPHWHYSDLKRLLKQQQYVPQQIGEHSGHFESPMPFPAYYVVLENGRWNRTLSDLPEGVEVLSICDATWQGQTKLTEIDAARHPMAQANLALMTDGVCIRIRAGQTIDRPICIRYLASSAQQNSAYHYRNIIIAEGHSQCDIIEQVELQTGAETLLNTVTQFYAEDNSQLTVYGMQQNQPGLTHINAWHSWLKRDARFNGHHLALGSSINRFDGQVYLTAAGAQYQHYGAFLLKGKQHVDFAFQVDHLASHTNSNVDFRGVADDQSTGVFNARAFADKHLKRLSIHQSSRNMVLSPKAKIYTQPALEIYTDDLVCTHGATVGALDRDALAYLQLRGVPEQDARILLQQAFLAENLQAIAHTGLRTWWQNWVGG